MNTDDYIGIMENLLDSIEAWLETIEGTRECRQAFDDMLTDVDEAVIARTAYYSDDDYY
jgi:predicted RecB family nuclease